MIKAMYTRHCGASRVVVAVAAPLKDASMDAQPPGHTPHEVDLAVRLASVQAVGELANPTAAARAVLQAVALAIPFDWAAVLQITHDSASVVATYPSSMLGIEAGSRWQPLDHAEQVLLASGEPSLEGELRAGALDRSPLARLPLLGVRSVLRLPLFDARGVAGAVLLYSQLSQAFTAAQGVQLEAYVGPLARRLFRSPSVASSEAAAALAPPVASPPAPFAEHPGDQAGHPAAEPAPAEAAPARPAGGSWPAPQRDHPEAAALTDDGEPQPLDGLNALSDLVSGVAHELNNPLTTILGFAQVLPALGESERPHALAMIEQEAQRAGRIVRNLLYFARQHRPRIEPVDLNALLVRVVEVRRHHFAVDNVRVETGLTPLPLLNGDQYQLEQAFLNLLNNAYQAMQATGGTITISSHIEPQCARVTITDTGPGVPDAFLTRIFEPFFTTREVGQGTGLGLSIAYGIVREHGGRLWAENPPSGGACFVIELPLPAKLADPPEEPSRPAPVGRGEQVLIVDDEQTVRSLVREILEGFNYRVLGAASGAQALTIMEETPCDVIICDVRMPGMDGYELHRRLLERWPALQGRVIFVTGDIDREMPPPLPGGPLPRFLEKPFDIHDLVAAVRMATGQPAGRTASSQPGPIAL